MDYAAILERTATCVGGLPKREVGVETQKDYRKTFARMLRQPVLDPLSPGIAIDTYQHKRAALHWGSRFVLERLYQQLKVAFDRKDAKAVKLAAAMLVRLLTRIEPALQLDPPLEEGASALQSSASRWKAAAGPHPKRGANSKRHVLGLLPPQWDSSVWKKALEVWTDPSDEQELDALAVRRLAPIRSEDLVPGDRACGWSEGVVVKLHSPHRLDITIAPAKSHNGKFGTGITIVKINPMEAGEAASYLAARCSSGVLVVRLDSKEASRKRLLRLGKIALPDCDVNITPNVFRNQVIADFKATVGAGVAVAAACGHCTDRTQSKYGLVQHGRRRRGLIGVASQIAPRAGNIERARNLSKSRSDASVEPLNVSRPVEAVGSVLEPNNVGGLTERLLSQNHASLAASVDHGESILNEQGERSTTGAKPSVETVPSLSDHADRPPEREERAVCGP